jgi:beta propeller repeat protein
LGAVTNVDFSGGVWTDARDGNWDIYGYNLVSQTEYPITSILSDKQQPAIHGDNVVWMDSRNGGSDIYGYNLVTGIEYPIWVDPGDQFLPAIYGDNVVWLERVYRNGGFVTDVYIVTIRPGAGAIFGHVGLQDVVEATSQITFELRSPGTTTIVADASNDENPAQAGTQVTTDNGGWFTLCGIPPGTYDLSAKGSKWLRQNLANIVVAPGNIIKYLYFSLTGGDANNDNSVNVNDLNILKVTYGKSASQSGYDERADFNQDNKVNVLDLNIMKRNYAKRGDP